MRARIEVEAMAPTQAWTLRAAATRAARSSMDRVMALPCALMVAKAVIRTGCEKVDTGFSLKSRSELLESITCHDFGLIQSKVIVI